MPDPFHKFPATPHIAWLADASIREDKLLTPAEKEDFLSGCIVVEEKVDGANLGISFDAKGTIRFQNRGNWFGERLSDQWGSLRQWAGRHLSELREVLPKNHILFGEWCYAVHSIRYDCLPDWFLGFDVYDNVLHRFWSTRRRDTLLTEAGISKIPRIAEGVFTMKLLREMLGEPSALGRAQREGLYLRSEDNDWLSSRAKLVNPVFTQQIGAHWSKQRRNTNALLSPIPL